MVAAMSEGRQRRQGAARPGDDLAAGRCVPCKKGALKLTDEEIAGLLWQLDGWECEKRHHLAKSFAFPDFAAGLAFVNQVARLAQDQGHHPDVLLRWGLVRLSIFTHTVDGLTAGDFILAAKIDRLPPTGGA